MKSCEVFVNKILQKSPSKYKAYCFFISEYLNGNYVALDTLEKVIDLFQDNNFIIEELNRLLPESLKVPSFTGSSISKSHSEHLNARLQENFKRMKETDINGFGRMLDFLNQIHNDPESMKHDKFINYLKHNWPREKEIIEILRKLKEIEEQENSIQKKQTFSHAEEEFSDPGDFQHINKFRQQSVIPKNKNTHRVHNNHEEEDFPEYKPSYITNPTPQHTIPISMKSEFSFFEFMKGRLSPIRYNEFIKCIFLYSNCIITSFELFALTLQLFNESETDLINTYKDIILSREGARRKLTQHFKPLGSIDFKRFSILTLDSERASFSYTKLPESQRVENKSPFLNNVWVSVPHGSEHFSFNNMRKNVYEEALFKVITFIIQCEDERYDFDININIFNRAISLLETILHEFDSLNEIELEDQMKTVMSLRLIQNLYCQSLRDFLEKYEEGDRDVKKKVIETFYNRLQRKLSEIQDFKDNLAQKNWLEVCEKNFHKSLDHRSFYFKKMEKKINTSQS